MFRKKQVAPKLPQFIHAVFFGKRDKTAIGTSTYSQGKAAVNPWNMP